MAVNGETISSLLLVCHSSVLFITPHPGGCSLYGGYGNGTDKEMKIFTVPINFHLYSWAQLKSLLQNWISLVGGSFNYVLPMRKQPGSTGKTVIARNKRRIRNDVFSCKYFD